MITSRKWLLVAEDETEIRELVCDKLQDHFGPNLNIVQAVDGLDATRRLPFQVFDCIVTDLKMPRKEGTSFIDAVRASQLNEFTPVIVVTGNPMTRFEDDRDYIYQLSKPINFDKLTSLLETQLRLGKTNQRLNADLVNCFIDSAKEFHQLTFEHELTANKPMIKQRGEEFKGAFFRHLQIMVDRRQTRFLIGFSRSYLASTVNHYSEFNEETKRLDIVNFIGHQHFYRSMQKVADPGNLRIANTEAFAASESYKHSQLINSRGLLIKLESAAGTIYFYVF